MSLITITVALLILAACGYIATGIGVVRAMKIDSEARVRGAQALLAGSILCHGLALGLRLCCMQEVYFGFGMAISIVFFLAAVIFLIESAVRRISGLMGVFMMMTGVATVFPLVFGGQAVDAARWTTTFKLHLILAFLSYSFIMIACVQSVFLILLDRALKNPLEKKESALVANMPSLMAMERILYRIVALGFGTLTLVLITGAFVTNEAMHSWISFDHKTILTWAAWAIFGVLMVGHYGFGWRRRLALIWFWSGTVTLMLAYLIYRFVLDVQI